VSLGGRKATIVSIYQRLFWDARAGIEQEKRVSTTRTESARVQRAGPRTALPGIASRCNSPFWICAMIEHASGPFCCEHT